MESEYYVVSLEVNPSLLEFKNRLVGYAMAIGSISSIVKSIFAKNLGYDF